MSTPGQTTVPDTVAAAVEWGGARLDAAGLHFGHGADNPHTEAIILLAGATGWALERLMGDARQTLDAPARARFASLIEQRIATRRPASYLVNRAWFAGLEFHVDERVLVPRSPLAELIADGVRPWLEPGQVRRVLDVGTGSGCLAIACAHAFPAATVDAVDVSAEALAVARINVDRLVPDGRVVLKVSDHFSAVADERYDLIISNPPYVPRERMAELPPEYGFEPRLALESGDDGLDSVRAILHDAPRLLAPGGVLVVEVGEVQDAVVAAFPDLPFIWLEFAGGGEGVLLLSADAPAHDGAAHGRAPR